MTTEATNLTYYTFDNYREKYKVTIMNNRSLPKALWRYDKSFSEVSEFTECIEKIEKALLASKLSYGIDRSIVSNKVGGETTHVTYDFDVLEKDIPATILNYFRFLKAPLLGKLFWVRLPRSKWLKAIQGYLAETHYHHVYLFYIKDSDDILVFMSNYPETFDLRGGGFKHIFPSDISVYDTLTHRNQVQRASLTLFEMVGLKSLEALYTKLANRLASYKTLEAKPIIKDTTDETPLTLLEHDKLYRFNYDDTHGLRIVQHTIINSDSPYVLIRDEKTQQHYFYLSSVIGSNLKGQEDYFTQNGINVVPVVQHDTNLNKHYGYAIAVGETHHLHLINILSIATRGQLYHQYPNMIKDPNQPLN